MIDITQLTSYLPAYLLIGVVVAYVFGIFLKKSALLDKYIPIALMIFCITLAVALTITNTEYGVTLKGWIYGVMYGIIIWGVAIGVNQTNKQITKDE